MPVALAMLLTFLLSPCDRALQRLGLGRTVSVSLLAVLTFSLIGGIRWAASVQVKQFANNLPSYHENIKKRIEDLRVGQGTTLDKVRTEFDKVVGDVNTNTPASEQATKPVPVTVEGGRFSSGMWQLSLMLFSQSAGTCKLAMLIAIAFWTWLWGPVGLLLATPLTACWPSWRAVT